MDSSSRSFARLVAPLAACVGAIALLSLQPGGDNLVDRALPLYATAIAAIALLEGRRFGDATLAFALPLLGVVRVAVFDENLRVLLYGAVLATAAAAFVARVIARSGRLAVGEGLVLTAACVAAMKLVPWSASLVPAQLIVVGGTLLLVLTLAGRDGLGGSALLVCIAAGIATPLEPVKAALFPIVLASLLAVVRGPSPFSIAAVVGTAALAGRWTWPMAALVLGAGVLGELLEGVRERRGAPAHAMLGAAPPIATTLSTGALAAFAFSPESLLRMSRISFPSRAAALALGGAALVLRPALGALYMIAALAIVMSDESSSEREREAGGTIPVVAAVFCVAMVALAGWSGAVVSKFPLPLPVGGVVAVALVAFCGAAARRSQTLAIGTAALIMLVAIAAKETQRPGIPVAAGAALAQREAFETDLPDGGEVRVELSGGNLAALGPGTVVGSVELFDGEGRSVRRDVAVGDLADWGFGRPGHYFASKNSWPLTTGATVADYGARAFFGGGGSVRVSLAEAKRIRVSAAPSLPSNGKLNVDGIEVAAR